MFRFVAAEWLFEFTYFEQIMDSSIIWNNLCAYNCNAIFFFGFIKALVVGGDEKWL